MRKYGLVSAVFIALGCLLVSTAGAEDPNAVAWSPYGPLNYQPTTDQSLLRSLAETIIAFSGWDSLIGDSVRVSRDDYYPVPVMCSPWKSRTEVVQWYGFLVPQGAYFALPGGQCMDPDIPDLWWPPDTTDTPDIHDWLRIEIKHQGTWYPVLNALTNAGVSSDVVNDAGKRPYEPGYVKPSLTTVSLTDAVYVSPLIKSATYELCTDLNGDGSVDLDDAVVHTAFIKNGCSCYVQ